MRRERLVVLLIPEKFPSEVFSKIKSEAYFSANLLKPVLTELSLVLVRSFAFCPGGPPRICFLVCFLVYRFWIEISETDFYFFVTTRQFYLLLRRAEV